MSTELVSHDSQGTQISVLIEKVNSLGDSIKTLVEDIKKIQEVTYGNGQLGLVGKVTTIEKWVESQIWFQRLIIGAIVGQIILIFVYLFKVIP